MYAPTPAGLAAMLQRPLCDNVTLGRVGLGDPGLGDISTDIMRLLGMIPMGPGQTAASKFEDFKNLVRSEAQAGAKGAIPEIQIAVKKQVTPYVIGALGLGFLGAVTGLLALRAARKHS